MTIQSVVPDPITLQADETSGVFSMNSFAGGHFQIDSGDVTSISWYASPKADGTFKEMIDPSTGLAVTQTVSLTGDYAIPYSGNGRLWLQPRIGTGTTGVMSFGIKN